MNALDKHHFHHLFTSIRIKDNESATSYLRRFVYAKTEAEGASNVYTEQQLVDFALSGLSATKNTKYKTAVQLYNLEQENGRTFTLQDIEQKKFSIDEKSARDQALTRLSLGNAATSHHDYNHKRGNRRNFNGSRNNNSGRRNNNNGRGYQRSEQAHLANHSNPIICYNCSDPGHTAPKCPKPKQSTRKPGPRNQPARGNAAISSANANTQGNTTAPAIVRTARAFHMEHAFSAWQVIELHLDETSRRPNRPMVPRLEISHDGSDLLNADRYVTLTVPVDMNHFNDELERRITTGQASSQYIGSCNPLQDGIWMMIHDHPLAEQNRYSAAIIYPDHQNERIFSEGIIPVLEAAFSLNPEDLPGCFTRWCNLIRAYTDRRLTMEMENIPVTVTSRNMMVSISFYPLHHERPVLVCEGHGTYILPISNIPSHLIEGEDDDDMVLEQAFSAALTTSASASAIRRTEPSIQDIGDLCDLNNYLPDSGATQHMTPRLMDLTNVVEGQRLGVEVANGHIIKCSTTGDVKIRMQDDNCSNFTATLKDVMYVPGLSRRLFSITKFACHGHKALIQDNGIILYFEPHAAAVTLSPLSGTNSMAAGIRVHTSTFNEEYHSVPSARHREHTTNKKRLSLELLHTRLGHRKCRTLLAASEHNLWEDVTIRMSPETGCLGCGIATIRSTAHNKEPHTAAVAPGKYICLDILHPTTAVGLTPHTSYAFYLILVDTYSRYTCIYGLPDKTTDAVVAAIKQYTADHRRTGTYSYLNLERIRADAGSQFTSEEFLTFCRNAGVQLVLAAPKK